MVCTYNGPFPIPAPAGLPTLPTGSRSRVHPPARGANDPIQTGFDEETSVYSRARGANLDSTDTMASTIRIASIADLFERRRRLMNDWAAYLTA